MIETSKIYKYKTKKRNFQKCIEAKIQNCKKDIYIASGDAEKNAFKSMKKKNLLGVKRYGRETRETHTGNDDGDEKWTKFLEIQSKTMFKTEKRKVKKNYDDWLLHTHKKTKINTRKYHSFLHSFQHST